MQQHLRHEQMIAASFVRVKNKASHRSKDVMFSGILFKAFAISSSQNAEEKEATAAKL
jgi:hypothetical protein